MEQPGQKRYSNGEVTVIWEPSRCIHSEKCFHGLPAVFDPRRRPWIDIRAAATAAIAEQVRSCPSGALSLAEAELAPVASAATTVELLADGPLLVHGEVSLRRPDGSEERKSGPVALCRCGASANKPFCDGSHSRAGFKG